MLPLISKFKRLLADRHKNVTNCSEVSYDEQESPSVAVAIFPYAFHCKIGVPALMLIRLRSPLFSLTRILFLQGTLAGLLIGLGQLNCSELRLKRLCCRSGLLGMDRVINYALSEWLADIRSTQLPRILGGVGPVHSFLQLFQGLVDLVWLPIDQYRRDGRVMRGLQRGANSFTTSSAMAFLELTNRVVQIIQVRGNVLRNLTLWISAKSRWVCLACSFDENLR